MKKLFYTFTLLTAVAFTAVGCNDETEPLFDGMDNGLTSFSVTANGVTYKAAITDNEIVVSAPVGADLSTAEVQYNLCEHATITPDPKAIRDWNSEHVFRIKSYNKSPREYTYSISRTDVSKAENVELLTQSDVENFAKLGITRIDGNLSIGSDTKPVLDSVVNLEGLASLKEVRYNIIVNRSFAGGTLKGLENIERCGGLHIGTTTSQVELPAQSGLSIDLPLLKTVGDIVLNSNSIKSLAFEKLESAASVYIASNSIVTLKAPMLKQTVSALSLENNSNSSNSILSEIALPKLEKVGGKLSFQSFSGVTSISLPKLNYVGGDVNMALNSNILEELSLPELATVKGAIIMERTPGLLKLSIPKIKEVTSFIYNKSSYGSYPLQILDLSALETIEKEIYVRGIPIEQVNFPRLAKVGSDITFWDLKATTSIKMPALKKLGKKLQLYSVSQLETLDISPLDTLGQLELIGCLALKTVTSPATIGEITLNYASNAACLTPEFAGLEQVSGKFEFASDYQTKLYDVKHIKRVGTLKLGGGVADAVLNLPEMESVGTLEISSSNLAELNAPKLSKVDHLKFTYISKLTTLRIPLLKRVRIFALSEHNSWSINSARMTDLNAYAGINSVDSVAISFCNKLVDFSGLKNTISTINAAKWSVSDCAYNPTYQDMVDGKYTKP